MLMHNNVTMIIDPPTQRIPEGPNYGWKNGWEKMLLEKRCWLPGGGGIPENKGGKSTWGFSAKNQSRTPPKNDQKYHIWHF